MLMRQHANRIETELIVRKGQQLTGQSPTICACGKIIMNQLADHMSITFMLSKDQDKRPFSFANSQYWFSSDHQSQAWSGEVNTWMGDRLGILRVVDL